MSTILTIDFDIIMAPAIDLYNDLIGDEKGVNQIITQYPLLEYTLTGDLFIYEAVTRGLVSLFHKVPADKVHFITEHHNIVPLVENLEEFKLINIDHHHDIGYNNVKTALRIRKPDCGNWVKYLTDIGKVKEYVWICNKNSNMPNSSLHKSYLKDYIEIQTVDFRKLEDIDELIICNSPQWIPPNLQALFMSWVGIAEEFYGKNFDILQAMKLFDLFN